MPDESDDSEQLSFHVRDTHSEAREHDLHLNVK
jgi:hypothetical protein